MEFRYGPLSIAQFSEFADIVEQNDNVEPFSEAAFLNVKVGQPVYVMREGEQIIGVGWATGTIGELAIHPQYRRRGLGRLLIGRLQSGGVEGVWAHGDKPGASVIAGALGWTIRRTLLQMRSALHPAQQPLGPWTLRSYRDTGDIADLLEVNRRAFTDLPDQGSWQESDVKARITESWFQPAGLILAVHDGKLIGFHWTKQHHDTLGEIYVLAVAPEWHGRGLGRALAIAGLNYLVGQGCTEVMLYCDADNHSAVSLYEKLGFICQRVDVLYGKARKDSIE